MNRSKQRKLVLTLGLTAIVLSLAVILLMREKKQEIIPSPSLPLSSRSGPISAERLFNNVIQLSVAFSNGESSQGFALIVAEQDNILYAVTANHLTFADQPDVETEEVLARFYMMKGKFLPAKLSKDYDEERDLTLIEVQKPSPTYQWERHCFYPYPGKNEKIRFIGRDQDWFVPENQGFVIKPSSLADPFFTLNIAGLHPGTAGAPVFAEKGICGMIVQDSPPEIKALDIDMIRIAVSQEWGYPWQLPDTRAQKKAEASDEPYQKGEPFTEPLTGMEFLWIPGGCYEMGCGTQASECQASENPVHEVCVSGFLMGKYEVTQGQWKKIMGNNPSMFQKGDEYPADAVSWYDAEEFISRLNGKTGGNYRLPREAEWEYACRSPGKAEKYAGGAEPEPLAWYMSDSQGSTHPAGAKSPNGSGLYDMSGNLWEWCEDIFHEEAYRRHTKDNPAYLVGGSERVLRGGSWRSRAGDLRCACRYSLRPGVRYNHLGFRLVKQ